MLTLKAIMSLLSVSSFKPEWLAALAVAAIAAVAV